MGELNRSPDPLDVAGGRGGNNGKEVKEGG